MDRPSIDYAQGRVFPFDDESTIRPDILQTKDYSDPLQRISYQMNEFAAVCPFSRLTDARAVCVDDVPQSKLVEKKSMKYYFISFRNVGIYQEDVISGICNDLNLLLEPEELLVKTCYSNRGGVDTTCTINSNEQKI